MNDVNRRKMLLSGLTLSAIGLTPSLSADESMFEPRLPTEGVLITGDGWSVYFKPSKLSESEATAVTMFGMTMAEGYTWDMVPNHFRLLESRTPDSLFIGGVLDTKIDQVVRIKTDGVDMGRFVLKSRHRYTYEPYVTCISNFFREA